LIVGRAITGEYLRLTWVATAQRRRRAVPTSRCAAR